MPFFQVCRSVGNSTRSIALLAESSLVKCASSCFAFLASTPERRARLARTTITSTPRSVNDVEVRTISNLLVDQGGLLPVRAMECQFFM